MNVSTYGLCVVKDSYFLEFPNVRHVSNKHENRPYYLAVHGANGIIWVIPLSSKVDKYREKIKQDEQKYGNCLFYYITRVKGQRLLDRKCDPGHRSLYQTSLYRQ